MSKNTYTGSVEDLRQLFQIPINCQSTSPSDFLQDRDMLVGLSSFSMMMFLFCMGNVESTEWPSLVPQFACF